MDEEIKTPEVKDEVVVNEEVVESHDVPEEVPASEIDENQNEVVKE